MANSHSKGIEANLTRLLNFLNAFQGGYKNGLEDDMYTITADYCWFAGLYFFLRVAIFVIYAFTLYWFMQCVLQQFVCITALVL